MIKYKRVFTGAICNNQCAFCPNDPQRAARPVDEILDEIGSPEGDVDSLELFGGEPTIRNDIDTIAKEARGRGWRRLKLVTNARGLAVPQAAFAVLSAGIRVFEVKLYGHAPQLHDQITGCQGSFTETVQGLANLRRVQPEPGPRPFVGLRVGVTASNYPYLAHFLSFAMQLEADRVTFRLEAPSLPLSEVTPHLKHAINVGLVNSVWTQTERAPLCFMDGYEHHVREAFAGTDEERRRVEACERCAYETCAGIWPGYLEARGGDDLLPVLESACAKKIGSEAE